MRPGRRKWAAQPRPRARCRSRAGRRTFEDDAREAMAGGLLGAPGVAPGQPAAAGPSEQCIPTWLASLCCMEARQHALPVFVYSTSGVQYKAGVCKASNDLSIGMSAGAN